MESAQGAWIQVDGKRVLGTVGRGITDHFGLQGQVDIEIGALSKAFGVIGGYIASPQVVIDYLIQRGRPFLFSSAATPADVAACIATLDILQNSAEAVQKLWENTSFFQDQLRDMGFDLGHTQTPITPIMVGDSQRAKAFSAEPFKAGVFAQAIKFPTVPQGTARLRLMLSASHSRPDLEFASQTLARTGKLCRVVD